MPSGRARSSRGSSGIGSTTVHRGPDPAERLGLAARRAVGVAGRLVVADAAQRPLAVLALLPADLAGERDPLEPRDLALALNPRGVLRRERGDQLADAVAQLEGEVRGGRAHELADVVDGDAVLGAEALRLLGFGHARESTSRRPPPRPGSRAASRSGPGRRRTPRPRRRSASRGCRPRGPGPCRTRAGCRAGSPAAGREARWPR